MDTLTADALAEALQEPKKALLAKVLRTMGPARCAAILAETLTIEAHGGMLVQAGDRRRTPGGTFFHLVRQQCTRQERARLFPSKPATHSQAHHGPAAVRPPAAVTPPVPVPLTLDLWKGLTPMAVTATLKLVLRE